MQEFIVAAHKAQLIIAVVWLFHFPPPSLSISLSCSHSLGDQLKRFCGMFLMRFFLVGFLWFWLRFRRLSKWLERTIKSVIEKERVKKREREWEREGERDLIVKEKQIELKTQFQFEINFSTELFLGPCLWHLNKNSIPRPNGGGETGAGGDWRHAMPWWPNKMRMHKLGGLRCEARNQKRKNEKKKSKTKFEPTPRGRKIKILFV